MSSMRSYFLFFLILANLGFTLLGCSLASDSNGSKSSESATSMAATLLETKVQSYDVIKAQVLFVGQLNIPGITELNTIEFYLDSTCSDLSVGRGSYKSFKNQGLLASISSLENSSLYIKTNTDYRCYFLVEYTPKFPPPEVPVVSGTDPPSPSREVTSPLVFGTVVGSIQEIRLFSDSLCMQSIGAGDVQEFTTKGISVALPSNTESAIYLVAIEPFGLQSPCTWVGEYRHSNVGPSNPLFLSISPLSPSFSVHPTVMGVLSDPTISRVTLFSEASCKNQVGQGSASQFTSNGLEISINSNQITDVYALAWTEDDLPSQCTYLTRYSNDTIPPLSSPTFTATNPVSPTRLTIYPRVKGQVSSDTHRILFYDGVTCTHLIGSGLKNEFEGPGILVTAQANATTLIYAAAEDLAGNRTSCVYMTQFINNTIPPDPPLFLNSDPVSPNNQSVTPKLFGSVSATSEQLQFYDHETCLTPHLIGSGLASDFLQKGISVTVPMNATTLIYGVAIDGQGNISTCTPMFNYAHSILPASPPAFSSSIPASPSNNSVKPYFIGTTSALITSVDLFLDSQCAGSLMASGPRATFQGGGLQLTVPSNSISSVYSVAHDIYGNSSPCTLLTTYIHDNKQPPAPQFMSYNPLSPNNTSYTPTVKGLVYSDLSKISPSTTVSLFSDNLCLGKVGSGTVNEFQTSGIVAALPSNTVSFVYAQVFDNTLPTPGNKSACTYMLTYTHCDLVPGDPQLSIVTPASPSFSQRTLLTGTIKSSANFMNLESVKIYSDSLCQNLLSFAAPSLWLGSGIPTIVPPNVTTSIYARTFDSVGNFSNCKLMTIFSHSNLGPTNLMNASPPNSPDGTAILVWSPVLAAQPAPTYIVKRAPTSGGPYTVIAKDLMAPYYYDTELINNENYYYVVAATNSTGTSYNSSELLVHTNINTPQAPNTLTATPGDSSIQLTWNSDVRNRTYHVFRSTSKSGPFQKIVEYLNATNYVDLSVANGITYFYYFLGINPKGTSVQSNLVSAVPLSPPIPSQNLVITPTPYISSYSGSACSGIKGVQLTWDKPSYYVDFNVERGNTDSNFFEISSSPISGKTDFVDCSPSPSSSIISYGITTNWPIDRKSARSTTAHFMNDTMTTMSLTPGHQEVLLSWTPQICPSSFPSCTLTYTLKRAVTPEGPFSVLSSTLTSANYTDSAVVDGTMYYYQVQAFYQTGHLKIGTVVGWPSQIISGTPRVIPAGPTHLTVQWNGVNPYLSWTSASWFNYYIVYRSTNSAGPYVNISSPTYLTSNAFSDNSFSLSSGTLYYYKVVAVWGNNLTTESDIVSFRYAPISSFTMSAVTETSVSLSWNPVSNASQYQIYRWQGTNAPILLSTFVPSPITSPVVFSDTSVVPATGYQYSVLANFADGTVGQDSVGLSTTTPLNATTPLVPPEILSLRPLSSNQIYLSWSKVPAASTYSVYYSRGDISGTYTLLSTTAATSTTLSIPISPPPSPTNFFYFKIVSVSGSSSAPSVSTYSTIATSMAVATDMATPTVLPNLNSISLSFACPSYATCSVERSTDGNHFSAISLTGSAPNWVDSAVTSGTRYFYRTVGSYSGIGDFTGPVYSGSSAATSGMIPPTPSGLSVTSNSSGTTLSLAWESIAGASAYCIYHRLSTGPTTQTCTNTSNLTIGTTAPLVPDQIYYISVSALNNSMESPVSSPELEVVPSTPILAPVVKISGPTTAQLSWTPLAVGGVSYTVQRTTDFKNIVSVSNVTSPYDYTDAGINPHTAYYYRILPYQSSVSMVPSGWSSAKVFGTQLQTPMDLTTHINWSGAGPYPVTLSWVPVSNSVSYNIYRSTSSTGPFLAPLTSPLASSGTEFIDSTTSLNTTYYYKVSAVNDSGVESSLSNTSSIYTGTSLVPTTLTATVQAPPINAIYLSWSSVAGATSYVIKRSTVSGGGGAGYLFLQSGVTNTFYQDTDVTHGVNYYYVVAAISSVTGATSINSNEVSAIGSVGMSLQVPIELIDRGIASGALTHTFERSRTTLDTTAYDGSSVTYELEAVVDNSEGSSGTLALVDSSLNVLANLIIPANTLIPKRIRVSFTPTISGLGDYRLRLSGTTIAESVKVYSSRILVTQVHASKTKLYYPLIASQQGPTSSDLDGFIESTFSQAYQILPQASLFKRNTTHLQNINEDNAWELETLVSSVGTGPQAESGFSLGSVYLYNNSKSMELPSTHGQFDKNWITMVRSVFSEGKNLFDTTNENDLYQVGIQCDLFCDPSTSKIQLYKAGIWVSLHSLNKAEVQFRSSLGLSSTGTSVLVEERTQLQSTFFSNPIFNFQSTVDVSSGSTGTLILMDASTEDFGANALTGLGTTNFSLISSGINLFSSTAPFTPVNGNRFVPQLSVTSGTIRVIDTKITVSTSR